MNANAKELRTPHAELERITPFDAAKYLEANRSNRPISRSIVDSYVGAMLAGEWLVNGESIKFDWNGELVDGQHRLAAIVKAKTAQWFFVVRELDPEVFKTLDTGRKRSASDVFAIRKIYNPNAVAVACRLLHRTLAQQLGARKRISNSALDALLARHTRFIELATEADHLPYGTKILAPGQRMFAFYMAIGVDEPRARAFFRALSGHPDPTDRAQPNAVRLRERLTSTMDEIVKPASSVRLGWVIQAWNATLDGKPVERFSRLLTEIPEWDPMPRFR